MKKFILTLILLSLIACSAKEKNQEVKVIEKIETITIEDPGAVDYVWEPPMVDVVQVPPGIDPEGTYYRPSHEEVVEIRQGRWRYKPAKDYSREK